ncbi:pectinesterase inhibitor 11-like [Telopea speciosissima]|uniref:pectinesterase inhibitor 11-like n=1 Tax=Telopea speciosissima TaxID=54955 RepID=UPI001CC73139|nr:pectinesterase inhibitor 11-like [Telopea speciosissima]
MAGSTAMTISTTLLLFLVLPAAISAVPADLNKDFIDTNCKTTLYPDICYTSIIAYAGDIEVSPAKLARVAVDHSFNSIRSIALYVLNNSGKFNNNNDKTTVGVLKDCNKNFEDAVLQVQRSNREIRYLDFSVSKEALLFKISNVQTWLSAALTNQETCATELANIKSELHDKVVNSKKFVSIALALVNSYAKAAQAN